MIKISFYYLTFGRRNRTISKKVILVTGGTGFLGTALIKRLLEAGHVVRATKRSTSAIPDALRGNAASLSWVDADLTDYFALNEACEGVSKLYHCAAVISYDSCDKQQMEKVNVCGTANVVNIALDKGIRVVHVSSIAALGEPKSGKLTSEDDWWEYDKSKSQYSITKYESEMEVWRGVSEGLDAVIVNPSLIIGASAGVTGSGAVFSLVQKGLKFYTGGSVGVVDVEDVVKAMYLLMDNPSISGERFIINNVNLTNQELLSMFSDYLGRPAPSLEAKSWMLGVAWRVAGIASFFSGKAPLLTRTSVAASLKNMRFSNEKIIKETGLTFKPIDRTLYEISIALKNHDNK